MRSLAKTAFSIADKRVHVGCAGRTDIGSHGDGEIAPEDETAWSKVRSATGSSAAGSPGAIAPRFGLNCDGIQEGSRSFPR